MPLASNFPPQIDSIDKALAAVDVAYHMNHRGGEIGSYSYTKTGERSGKMVCANPYPCDFDMGIITAMAERFRPAGSALPRVVEDTRAMCRKKAGESCTYLITW